MRKVHSHEEAREDCHEIIRKHPHLKILLKQGEFGSTVFWIEDGEEKELHLDAYDFKDFPQLKLVDTTGAGDCFTGAFAVKMLEGASYKEALTFANRAGFLCITKFGAGPAIPTLKEIEETFGK